MTRLLIALTLTLSFGSAADLKYRRVLPGVMHGRAADGARIATTLWLVNLGGASGSFEFGFLPATKTSERVAAQTRALVPGETLRLNNALQDLYGLEEGDGALVVRGDQPFELRGVHPNYSNAVNALEPLGLDGAAHAIWLSNRSEADAEVRTDITAVLTAPNSAVTVSVYDSAGVLRRTEVVASEDPTIWRTSASQLLPDPEVPLGRVEFAVTAGEATGLLSITGRNAALFAQPERIAPASSEGTNLLVNGVTASTDLRLFNPNDIEQEITLEAVGFPGGPTAIGRMTVGPKGLVEIRGVFGAMGFVVPEGRTGALRLRAQKEFLAAGRGLPMASSSEMGFAAPNQPVALAGLQESAGQNSRVALLAGARGASGLLRLRTRFGDSIATAPIRLEGNEWQGRAIGAWFQREEIPSDARVDIELESGSAHGYAEILDTVTQSRLLVSAAALPTQTPVTQVASRLMFSSLPTSFTAGTPFEATVQALRADNSIDPSFTGTVDLRVASGPGSFQSAVTVSQPAAAGSATFRDLKLTAPGGYTLTATATGLQSAVSAAFDVAPAAPATPAIVRVGTFAGQNGYIAQGTLQIERAADGSETLRLNPNFRVSSGAGAVTVWLARSSGALNTGNSLRVGLISRVFQGEFTFPIPAQGSSGFTHVIVYCDAFRINFGAAQLLNP